jgi:hypothetical protein
MNSPFCLHVYESYFDISAMNLNFVIGASGIASWQSGIGITTDYWTDSVAICKEYI